MEQITTAGPETINGLADTVDEAIGMLRQGRYADLEEHFLQLQRQAADLEQLREALRDGGAVAPELSACCGRLGTSLFIFSEVAKQVATIESGLVQLVSEPKGGAYDREGHCDGTAVRRFRQEA